MTLSNIELYEALKKDLSEDAARMIAEVVPKATDLATKGDVVRVEGRIGSLESRIDLLEASLKGHVDSRLLRYTFAFFVPMWATMATLLGVLIART